MSYECISRIDYSGVELFPDSTVGIRMNRYEMVEIKFSCPVQTARCTKTVPLTLSTMVTSNYKD